MNNLHCVNVGDTAGGLRLGNVGGTGGGGCVGNGGSVPSELLYDIVESTRRRNTAMKMHIFVYIIVFCKWQHKEIEML